jgi:hypothetical protein
MKAKLPKNVADAIDYYRSFNMTNRALLEEIYDPQANQSGQAINRWLCGNDERYDVLYTALVNGYEVELTPEDKVRERYNLYISCEDRKERGMAIGIKEALNILGIKISGVNAE